MENVSFTWDTLTPRMVANAVHNCGAALLTGAIRPERLEYFAKALRSIYAEQDAAYRLGGLDAVGKDYLDGAITDGVFRSHTPFCLFDVISSTKMIGVLNAILGKEFYEKFTVVRRMAPEYKTEGKEWSNHLPFHSDAQYHDDEKFCINVWLPFTEGCAVSTPGLEVILEGYDSIRRRTKYNPSIHRTRDEYGRASRFENDFYISGEMRELAKEKAFAPKMQLGDVLIFSNWTIHRTLIPKGASQSRISLECRIEIDAIDPPAG